MTALIRAIEAVVTALVNVQLKAWRTVLDALGAIQKKFTDWLGMRVIVMMSLVAGIYVIVRGVVSMVLESIGELVTTATAIRDGMEDWATGDFDTPLQTIMDGLEWCNSFLPLNEVFLWCGLLTTLWLSCLVYRAIKSFIPTLS